MDDKDRVLKLYYRLATIQGKIEELKNSINDLDEEIKEYHVSDDKPVYQDKISNNKKNLNDVRKSIINIRNDLRNNL